MLLVFLGLLGLLIFTSPIFAGEPPIQISPADDSSVTSPTLNWQAPSYPLYSEGSPYRVQVDDDSTFGSVNRDRYKTTTSYSPEDLSDGTYFWRVEAKDASGTWSPWSSVWSFILTISTPTPSPTQIQSPTPAPSPSSTPQSTSSFIISNVPPQINSDQSFNVLVNLTLPNSKTTDYYLSGAFKVVDGTRYFGLTKINSNWVKYESANYLNQYKITADESGNWTGTLEVKPDISDTDYKGSGDYIFKVARYTSSGSGPTWSNDSSIKIISTGSDNQDSTPTNNSSITDPTNSPTSVKAKATISTQNKNYDRLVYQNASVAGATASATTSASSNPTVVKNQKQTSPIVWIGIIFIFAGASSLGYIYLRKNAKIHFPFGK